MSLLKEMPISSLFVTSGVRYITHSLIVVSNFHIPFKMRQIYKAFLTHRYCDVIFGNHASLALSFLVHV